MQMAENVLSRSGVEDFGLFVQLTRQVWFRRNKWVHEGVFTNPNVIIRKTEQLAEELKKKKKTNEQGSTSSAMENTNRIKKWLAPSQGWYKANWDVVIDKVHGRVGMGVVIREEKGQIRAAMS